MICWIAGSIRRVAAVGDRGGGAAPREAVRGHVEDLDADHAAVVAHVGVAETPVAALGAILRVLRERRRVSLHHGDAVRHDEIGLGAGSGLHVPVRSQVRLDRGADPIVDLRFAFDAVGVLMPIDHRRLPPLVGPVRGDVRPGHRLRLHADLHAVDRHHPAGGADQHHRDEHRPMERPHCLRQRSPTRGAPTTHASGQPNGRPPYQ